MLALINPDYLHEKLNYIMTQVEDMRRSDTDTAREMYEARVKVSVKEIEKSLLLEG